LTEMSETDLKPVRLVSYFYISRNSDITALSAPKGFKRTLSFKEAKKYHSLNFT
jgi:hypothetical protein